MPEPSLKLFTCRRCDDVVKLIEKERSCECGAVKGFVRGATVVLLGSARILEIDWKTYDGLAEGETFSFRVLRRAERPA